MKCPYCVCPGIMFNITPVQIEEAHHPDFQLRVQSLVKY